MQTPDVTLTQLGTVASSVIALAIAFGVGLSKSEQDAIVQVVSTLGPVLVAADALIRHGRSRAVAAQASPAAASGPVEQPAPAATMAAK